MKYELKNNCKFWWVKGMVVEGEINERSEILEIDSIDICRLKNEPITNGSTWYVKNESNCPVFDMHLTELYPFVSWEDKEPTLIQDILDRYEVIENEKI